MTDIRVALEVCKWLSLHDLQCVSAVSSFWHTAAANEEVWLNLLATRCEGLLLPDTSRLAPTSCQLYRTLFTPATVPVLWGSCLAQFDVRTRQTSFLQLSTDTLITKASYIALLPDTSLFVCGGDIRSGSYYDEGLKCAYRVAPINLAVSRLADMQEARRYPDACYYTGSAYVFGGGHKNRYLDSSEVYTVKAGAWSVLPRMHCERTSCTPTIRNGVAFLVGGFPSATLEAFHFELNTFRVLQVTLYGKEDCVAIVLGDELFTFTHQEMRKIDIRTEKVTEVHGITANNDVWSPCQPQWALGAVWFYYWHRNTVVCYVVQTKEFEDISSFQLTEVERRADMHN